VTGKEGFVNGDVLNSDNALGFQFQNAVDKQKRISMRQDLPDLVDVHYWHGKDSIPVWRMEWAWCGPGSGFMRPPLPGAALRYRAKQMTATGLDFTLL
jgi:hypothetical protein